MDYYSTRMGSALLAFLIVASVVLMALAPSLFDLDGGAREQGQILEEGAR